jgi:ABC-type polysaccharide/polyol phosphate transport system ATPase subunit
MRYHRTIKQMTVAALRRQQLSESFLAIKDVSFTVHQGESIGLMGLNGSGKSTLLKIINGVMKPDSGTVLTRGRIAGLIATGAGFHPQLSGRDNVYLNAAILGMSEAETNRKLDAIVEFADVGKFLDTPVGYYSSGMFSRLGFAVAVHTDSDIFLVDEVLAVGDKPFKKKCMQRMQEIRTRAARSSTSATPRARCARCATGFWSSRRACSASTARSTKASGTSSTTTARTTRTATATPTSTTRSSAPTFEPPGGPP